MFKARYKESLTVGEAANICDVSPRTMAKMIDTGIIKGFKIPGSKDRRVPMKCLIAFLRREGLFPFYGERLGFAPVAITYGIPDELATELDKQDIGEGCSFRHAKNSFEAGYLFRDAQAICLIVDYAIGRIEASGLVGSVFKIDPRVEVFAIDYPSEVPKIGPISISFDSNSVGLAARIAKVVRGALDISSLITQA